MSDTSDKARFIVVDMYSSELSRWKTLSEAQKAAMREAAESDDSDYYVAELVGIATRLTDPPPVRWKALGPKRQAKGKARRK